MGYFKKQLAGFEVKVLVALLALGTGCGPTPPPPAAKATPVASSTRADPAATPGMSRLELPVAFPTAPLLAQNGDKVWLLDPKRLPPEGIYTSGERPREVLALATLTKAGPETSQVDGRLEVPNALLIPLPRRIEVAHGDLVLALSRNGRPVYAIVSKVGDPSGPVVTPLNKQATTAELQHFSKPLEPGTFRPLREGLEPGARVFEDKVGIAIVLAVTDDKVLVLSYHGRLAVADEARLKALLLTPKVKKGDQVRAPLYGTPTLAEVQEVDLEGRRVKVGYDSDYSTAEYVEFGEFEVLTQRQPWNPHTRLGRLGAPTQKSR